MVRGYGVGKKSQKHHLHEVKVRDLILYVTAHQLSRANTTRYVHLGPLE